MTGSEDDLDIMHLTKEQLGLAPKILDFVTNQQLVAIKSAGFALVPQEPNEAMLSALDDDGEVIWGGGVEHYFRNDNEADWYGRQVWRAMVKAAQESAEAIPNEAVHRGGSQSDSR